MYFLLKIVDKIVNLSRGNHEKGKIREVSRLILSIVVLILVLLLSFVIELYIGMSIAEACCNDIPDYSLRHLSILY